MASKSEREKCYLARDSYFKCLDAHNIVSSRQPTEHELLLSEANPFVRQMAKKLREEQERNPDLISKEKPALPVECENLRKEFVGSCIPSWVCQQSISCYWLVDDII